MLEPKPHPEPHIHKPPTTLEQTPTTKVHTAHHTSHPSRSAERTFKEFVESIMLGEEFVTFPLEMGRLEFARVPLRIEGAQTLSVEGDEGWKVWEEVKVAVGGERAEDGKKADGKCVGGPTNGTSDDFAKIEQKAPVVMGRMTRSMTRKMALEKEVNQVAKGGTGSVTKGPAVVEPNAERGALEGVRGVPGNPKESTLPPPFVAHPKVLPRIEPTFSKCTTTFASLPVHLRNSLPFTTPAELTAFFRTHPTSDISKLIESVRERHLWTFALRHSHVLQTDPRLPCLGFHPPPPPCVAKINALRVRLENLKGFIHQLRTSQNSIPFVEYEFLYLERVKLEERIEVHGLEWYQHLAKYVVEYDELVTWLRLQSPIDTSSAGTLEEARGILIGEAKGIRVRREEDIRAAVDMFVGWADTQYNAMGREEVASRRKALRNWVAKKGIYEAEESKREREGGKMGVGLDGSRGRPRKRAQVEDLAERAGS